MMMLSVVITLIFYIITVASSNKDIENENGMMRFMWMTPIITNPMFPANHPYVAKMKSDALTYYKSFESRSVNRDRDATSSDSFYLFQQRAYVEYRKCLETHRQSSSSTSSCKHYLPESISRMVPQIINEISSFLKNSYIQDGENLPEIQRLASPEESSESLFLWIGIHGNGSFHEAHHHENSAVSGVFYLTAPTGAGELVFQDPRGALPPFGKTLRIAPHPGKIVLFPGWLMHTVLPSTNSMKDPRISISFNYDGRWSTTSDLSQAFFVEPEQE